MRNMLTESNHHGTREQHQIMGIITPKTKHNIKLSDGSLEPHVKIHLKNVTH